MNIAIISMYTLLCVYILCYYISLRVIISVYILLCYEYVPYYIYVYIGVISICALGSGISQLW